MNPEKTREYIHSWYLLLMSFFALLFLLINRKLPLDLPLIIFLFILFFKNGLKVSDFRRLLFYAFLFSFTLFMINILYPSNELKTGEIYHIGTFQIHNGSLVKAGQTMARLFLVSFLSMATGKIMDYTKVVLHLIVHKGLKLFWGYPILLALNSIVLFQKEYERIKINARLRDLPLKDKISIFFPLLVFAIRHSQRGALSLVTRGLSQEKSFFFRYDTSDSDKKIFLAFWIVYLPLLFFAFL